MRWKDAAIRLVLAPLKGAAAYALPPRCPGCGEPVEDDHRFCARCWSSLRFLGPPWCAGCNRPMAHHDAEARCGPCIADPPRHAGVRAAVAYGPVARTVALKLKYGGRLGVAETMARQMARLMPAGAALLVPVPLHPRRLWHRGFNQSVLVARRLTALTGVPTRPDVLTRSRATPVLRGLNPRERRRAVARAFAAGEVAKGQAVVLIDDVHTTGATADACTAALLKAGATCVTILCWARVVDDGD